MSTSAVDFVGYDVTDADATAALRHRFSDVFSVQAGLEAQTGFSTDSLGRIDYTLIGVPVSLTYDSTDSRLDPTRGVRLVASAAGFGTFLGSSLDLVRTKAIASSYYSIDPDSRFVLAGKVGVGGLGGPALDEIPANWRFYAGGGGSVRGYAYNSLGPTAPFGAVVGGRSLFEASAELRVKVTDTIGVVPFFDAGNAFASSFPNFSRAALHGGGAGRYATIRRSARSASTSPFRSSVAPATVRWRSMSASGRLSDGVASLPHPIEGAGDDRRAPGALRVGRRGRAGQGRARRPDLEGALHAVDQRLHRRRRRRALLRRVDQRYRALRSRRPVAEDRQGPADLEPARAAQAAARGRPADDRPRAVPPPPASIRGRAAGCVELLSRSCPNCRSR